MEGAYEGGGKSVTSRNLPSRDRGGGERGRRKEEGDNGPFKKSLNRELVSSPRLSLSAPRTTRFFPLPSSSSLSLLTYTSTRTGLELPLPKIAADLTSWRGRIEEGNFYQRDSLVSNKIESSRASRRSLVDIEIFGHI